MIIFPEILLIAEAFEETKAFVAEVAVTFPTTIAVPVEELLMPYAALPVPAVTFPVTMIVPAEVLSKPLAFEPLPPAIVPVKLIIPVEELVITLAVADVDVCPIKEPMTVSIPEPEFNVAAPLAVPSSPLITPTNVAEFVPEILKVAALITPIVGIVAVTVTPFNKLKVPPAVAVVVAPSFQSLEVALLTVTEFTVTLVST